MIDTARIRALCFDVDGTLSDTDDHLVAQLATALAALPGLSARRASRLARRVVMGAETPTNTLYGLLDRLGLDDEMHRVKSLVRRLRAQRRHLSGRSPDAADEIPHDMVPDVAAMLATLAARYPVSVISTGSVDRIEAFLTHHGVREHIVAVVGAGTTPRMKPYPDPLRFAADAMDAPPEACLMIGDTTVDIRTAVAAGAQSVGVLCGFGVERELRLAGADEIVATTSDVVALLAPSADALKGASAEPDEPAV